MQTSVPQIDLKTTEGLLAGTKVIVVGGSSGMGLATARLAKAAGAEVTIVSRHPTSRLGSENEDFKVYELDTRQPEAVEQFFSKLEQVDHLVISAGEMSAGLGKLSELPLESARAQFESRFWGPYHLARYGIPKLKPGGSLTYFTGVYGDKVAPGASVPSAVHGALERLARVLAVEVAPMRVNVVSPATTDTPLHGELGEDARKEWFSSLAQSLPAGRVAMAEDVAHAVLFLLTNPYVTGMVLRVDGGATLV